MNAFEFIIVFLSFAYALAFSHMLFAAARMIRHRRVLIFSWPHALWMANAVMLLFSNWISLYDFRLDGGDEPRHDSRRSSLSSQRSISPVRWSRPISTGDDYDMRAFHQREYRAYIGAILVLDVVSFAREHPGGQSGNCGLGIAKCDRPGDAADGDPAIVVAQPHRFSSSARRSFWSRISPSWRSTIRRSAWRVRPRRVPRPAPASAARASRARSV